MEVIKKDIVLHLTNGMAPDWKKRKLTTTHRQAPYTTRQTT